MILKPVSSADDLLVFRRCYGVKNDMIVCTKMHTLAIKLLMLVSPDYSMKMHTRKTVQEQLPENISELDGRMCQDFCNPRRYAGDLREMALRRNQLKMRGNVKYMIIII